MAKDKSEAAKVDRRRFLKQAGLVIGTAGATATVGSTAALAESEQPQGDAGYRETDHVRTYYKLAQL